MSSSLLRFPNPVNEVASRWVAGCVAVIAVVAIAAQQPWLCAVLAYGFLARVATGPTLSPLGQLATRVLAPRLARQPKLVPGPPKRFAQAIGATVTTAAAVAYLGFGNVLLANVLLALIVIAAGLESVLGLCLGCVIFGWLMRVGVISDEICQECNTVGLRYSQNG